MVNLFLLSAAIEWALETCMFLSQLFEISLNPGLGIFEGLEIPISV